MTKVIHGIYELVGKEIDLMLQFHDLVGALGACAILITYFLLQVNKIQAQSMLYSQLNLAGSSMIVYSLFFDFNLSAMLVEGAWMVISVVGAVVTWCNRSRAFANDSDSNLTSDHNSSGHTSAE